MSHSKHHTVLPERLVAATLRDLAASSTPAGLLVAHTSGPSSGLVALAQAVHFVQGAVLDPFMGLATFLPAWGKALGDEVDVPVASVYHALLTNLLRDKDAVGAAYVYTTIEGVAVNWTAFANQTSAAWRAAGGVRTLPALIEFVRMLRAFEPALPPPSSRPAHRDGRSSMPPTRQLASQPNSLLSLLFFFSPRSFF